MSGVASKITQERAKAADLGSINNPVKFSGQDYEKLKAQCLESKTKFEDPIFPAVQASLGKTKLGPDSDYVRGLEWKRPSEIQTNPVFIKGEAEREDVRQGSRDYVSHVVPRDQSFEKKNYVGIFHFKLWQYGDYMDVVVDDRLPTKDNKLIFAKSKSSNEFWSALLEKAYAKVNGSYEALLSGHVGSLEDFTAGVSDVYNTKSAPDDLFQKVQRALMENWLVGCTSFGKDVPRETPSNTNVLSSHIYSVTRAAKVPYEGKVVQLIRVRDPWGHTEWNGAWSDNAPEWDKVDANIRADLNIQENDGEFWMSFSDFLNEYEWLEMCDTTLSEACCGDNYRWCLTEFNGGWRKGSNAGGCKDHDTFWTNPQYKVTLEDPDGDTSKTCPMIVALLQKDRRKLRADGLRNFHIGFYIYKVKPSDNVPLGKEYLTKNKHNHVAEENKYSNYRQPVVTPDAEAEFDIVREELQKGEFSDIEVKDLLNKMLAKYPEIKSDGFSTETVQYLIKLMDWLSTTLA